MFLRNLLLAGILATTISSSTLETPQVEIEHRALFVIEIKQW